MVRCVTILMMVLLGAACSSPNTLPAAPTAPSPIPVQRNLNLTGTWSGTYTISSCTPTTLNDCRWYARPGAMELRWVQSGKSLSGTLRTDLIGTLDITGTVDDAGLVTITGERPGLLTCFGIGSETGVLARTSDWSAEVTKTGQLVGAFRQYALQTISSCYKAMFEYRSEITSLQQTQ